MALVCRWGRRAASRYRLEPKPFATQRHHLAEPKFSLVSLILRDRIAQALSHTQRPGRGTYPRPNTLYRLQIHESHRSSSTTIHRMQHECPTPSGNLHSPREILCRPNRSRTLCADIPRACLAMCISPCAESHTLAVELVDVSIVRHTAAISCSASKRANPSHSTQRHVPLATPLGRIRESQQISSWARRSFDSHVNNLPACLTALKPIHVLLRQIASLKITEYYCYLV